MKTKKQLFGSHWAGDTLNASGSKVFQYRNDNRLFVVRSGSSEIFLNKSEAQFLLSSLKRILTEVMKHEVSKETPKTQG